MKISTVAIASTIAFTMAVGMTSLTTSTAQAAEVKGKIEAVMKEGRSVKIGGKTYFLSGSRTNVCIGGKCDEDRGKLKAGMSCEGMTSSKKKGMEFKKVSCK
jgi:ribosomal protein S1